MNSSPQSFGRFEACSSCDRRIQSKAIENKGTRDPWAYRGTFDHRSAIAEGTGQRAQNMPPNRSASERTVNQRIACLMVIQDLAEIHSLRCGFISCATRRVDRLLDNSLRLRA